MFDGSEILGYVTAVVVLVLVPGPNTMLILAHSLEGGRAAGLAAAAGVEAGTLLHSLAAALGLSAVLSSSALAFDAVKYTGVVYLIFLGLRALGGVRRSEPGAGSEATGLDRPRIFSRALVTNVVNPKVALFFLAFLPQFVHPDRGYPVFQFLVLGLTVSTVGFCFGCLVVVTAARVSGWLRTEAFARWQGRLTGTVFLGLGLHLALADRT